jgi:hypothetical protein
MGIIIGILIFAVVIAVVVYFATGGALFGLTKVADNADVHNPRVDTLRYHVPDGQDPAVVTSALARHGYGYESEISAGQQFVTIACPAGADRERPRVRSVIGDAHRTSLEGPDFDPGSIEFEDET